VGKYFWALLSASVLAGCASRTDETETFLTPMELNKDLSGYDHKTVVVKGWLDYGFEERHLFQSPLTKDESEGNAPARDPRCTSIEVPETLRATATRLNHQYVLVEGLFLADIAGERVFLGLCNETDVQAKSIRSAR
jgi:hypothetical protein